MSQKIMYIMGACLVLIILKTALIFSVGRQKNKNINKNSIKTHKLVEHEPITIFVHGTLFGPPLSSLVHALDCPRGITPAKVQGNKFVHGRIGYTLSHIDPKEFNLDRFYLFGWTGLLDHNARLAAARELYNFLVAHKGPKKIFCHSHGGNVALLLSHIAQEQKNSNFVIDQLILLGTPVQKATAHLAT